MTKNDTYQIVTDRIMARLDEGIIPWERPWVGGEPPANFVSKRPYRGINVLMTALAGYAQPYWVTFNQAKALGGNIRKGERGTPVVLWKFLNKTDAEGEDYTIPLIRYFTVFNIEQTDGIELPALAGPNVVQSDARAEAVVQDFLTRAGLTVKVGGDRAYYSPTQDYVGMPPREQFTSTAHYYATLFHELVHATGHKSRLNREFKPVMMDRESYSNEELTAEIGAAFLMAEAGLEPEPVENRVSYIQSWLRQLGQDKKLVVSAAGRAQRAVDLILNVSPAKAEETEAAQPEVAGPAEVAA
jgi:antirestriction protein ArdC